jgi:hypothetical protein
MNKLATIIDVRRFDPYNNTWPVCVVSPDNKYDPQNAFVDTINGRIQITPGMWILTDIHGDREVMPIEWFRPFFFHKSYCNEDFAYTLSGTTSDRSVFADCLYKHGPECTLGVSGEGSKKWT